MYTGPLYPLILKCKKRQCYSLKWQTPMIVCIEISWQRNIRRIRNPVNTVHITHQIPQNALVFLRELLGESMDCVHVWLSEETLIGEHCHLMEEWCPLIWGKGYSGCDREASCHAQGDGAGGPGLVHQLLMNDHDPTIIQCHAFQYKVIRQIVLLYLSLYNNNISNHIEG